MAATTQEDPVAVGAPTPTPAPAPAPAPDPSPSASPLPAEAEEVEASKKIQEAGAPETNPKSSSFKEESNFVCDLKESEKKALQELRTRVAEAIKNNEFTEPPPPPPQPEPEAAKDAEETTKGVEEAKKTDVKEGEAAPAVAEGKAPVSAQEQVPPKPIETVAPAPAPAPAPTAEGTAPAVEVAAGEEPNPAEAEGGVVEEAVVEAKAEEEEQVQLWGVPLHPGKGDDRTDVVLLKFLRARDFKAKEAFTMLRNTILWRKQFGTDAILEEDLGKEFDGVAYMHGYDREGHPVCYNVYGIFQDKDLYQKTFADEAKRDKFLRWRVQFLEKGIRQLSFSPGGISSMVQITDLKNSPFPGKKELNQALALLQDNYPEFVAKKIFINVPWWYLALNTMLSPFVTQRTKSKFVIARPSRVPETLFKYISPEHVPVQYGGLSRENDAEFTAEEGGVSELVIKSGGKHIVEILATEIGTTVVWDLVAPGWEVIYGAEFVPNAEAGYTVIVQKSKKFVGNEEPVRNSFKIGEQGKVVLTIENVSSRKKKVLYRAKIKTGNPA